MKIIGYATASSRGWERQDNRIEQRKHMKALHQMNLKPIPKVLVEGIPGNTKPEWKTDSEYRRLLKKEEGNNA